MAMITWEVWVSKSGHQRCLIPENYPGKQAFITDKQGDSFELKGSFEHDSNDPQGAFERSKPISPLREY